MTIFAMTSFMAFCAECYKIVDIETLRAIDANRNDVMHLRGRRCVTFCIAVFAKGVACPIVLAELTPPMVVPSCGSLVACRASITSVGMAMRAELVHACVSIKNSRPLIR